jgi:hypothetical protein
MLGGKNLGALVNGYDGGSSDGNGWNAHILFPDRAIPGVGIEIARHFEL